jgi:hypothetical protein
MVKKIQTLKRWFIWAAWQGCQLRKVLHELHLILDFIDGLETFDISVQGIFMFTQTDHRSTAPNAVSETARFMTTQAL